jgi:hypothetical protein
VRVKVTENGKDGENQSGKRRKGIEAGKRRKGIEAGKRRKESEE